MVNELYQNCYLLYIPIFLLITGMCIGSFMNVVIYRLPRILSGTEEGDTLSLAWPPSHCPVCHTRIRACDNIPVLSWLILGGECRHCHGRISPVYPLTEVITGLWFVVVYLFYYGSANSLLTFSEMTALLPPLVLFCLLYCLVITDIRHYLIPDVLSLGLLWAGLVFSVFGLTRVSPFQAVTGCVLAYCIISAVQYGYRIIRRHEGLGGGDAKLFAAASVWVGLSQVPWLILFSAVCGGLWYGINKFYYRKILISVTERLPGQDTDDSNKDTICNEFYIPFGPAIALATLVLFFIQI